MPPLEPYPASHEAACALIHSNPSNPEESRVPRLNRDPVIHRRHYQIDAAT
jgi:hypothetical protein